MTDFLLVRRLQSMRSQRSNTKRMETGRVNGHIQTAKEPRKRTTRQVGSFVWDEELPATTSFAGHFGAMTMTRAVESACTPILPRRFHEWIRSSSHCFDRNVAILEISNHWGVGL